MNGNKIAKFSHCGELLTLGVSKQHLNGSILPERKKIIKNFGKLAEGMINGKFKLIDSQCGILTIFFANQI